MKKNIWKVGLIVFLVVLAGWNLFTKDAETGKWKLNLKPGLDLGGGTSLIYEFDTSNLKSGEQKGLAQKMIPILLRRIDPANVANIIMRPQGDTRIEIQLPIASIDTLRRRKAYDNALDALEKENINLMAVKRALSLPDKDRQSRFEDFIAGSEKRKEIVEELSRTYDQFEEAQKRRDAAWTQLTQIKEEIDAAGLVGSFIESTLPTWMKLDEKERKSRAVKYVEDTNKNNEELAADPSKLDKANHAGVAIVNKYVVAYKKWSDALNELTTEETGRRPMWQKAAARLNELNLNIIQLTDVLELSETSEKRKSQIAMFREQFPQRAEKIDAVVESHRQYSAVSGRLDDPEDLKRMLKGAGVLEFRILPTYNDSTGKTDTGVLAGYIEALETKGPKLASDNQYVWCQVESPDNFGAEGAVLGSFGEKVYVLTSNRKNEKMLHDGGKDWQLTRAMPTVDRNGRNAIDFSLDAVAANLFFNLSKNNIGRPLCILLDSQAISAPNLRGEISSRGEITGSFSDLEQADLINKLNAGSFRASLSEVPISEKSIGATIGADNRDSGITAGLFGMAAVAVFMLIYYLRSGLTADIALFLNLLFVLGMMSMFGATFTLPGIAGLILTIGMSVDANVLIFERIREEQQRGSSLRIAISNGYARAFRTIFDANITTFFVAMILYMVASEEIKGFAIVLMLGIVSSMFTALFVTRTIYDIQIDSGLLRDHITMLQLIKRPNINWMGLRPIFFGLSIILIASGMTVFFTRDDSANSKFDIEFTGGTSVQIDLKTSSPFASRDAVEQRINEVAKELSAKVYSIGDTGEQYEITTTETNKTIATVTFEKADSQTVESVTEAITRAAEVTTGTLYKLNVAAGDNGTFIVSTSQANRALVKTVLESAFGENATVSEPTVDEVVSNAIQKAFEGYLTVREDLGVEIASTKKVGDMDVELAEFMGGIKIACKLNRETTAGELKTRFKDIRFKPDAQDLTWYRYDVLGDDMAELSDETKLSSFVYVSVHPDAGYRELEENEWNGFIENEQTRIIKAGSLSTTLSRITQIDPSVGAESKTRALIAIMLSLIAIIAYIWVRFGTARYGIAAIAALVHDVCITLGAVTACTYLAGTPIGKALLIGDFKINLQTIAAFLTIIGYSLNDTIVVFDRIRENRGKLSTLTPQIITNSINQTLSRTILTSLTTFMVVLVMYIWGGAGLRGFTFAMLIGIIVGTYSSIAIATPILLIGVKKDMTLKKHH